MYTIKNGVLFGYSADQADLADYRVDNEGHKYASADEISAITLANEISIPQYVTRAQCKAALIRSGLWQGVIDYVASIDEETEKAVAEVALNDTTHWQRSSPFLNEAAQALGLTDEQLDDLFVQASKIEL